MESVKPTTFEVKIPSFNPIAYVPIDVLIEQFKNEIVVIGEDENGTEIGQIYSVTTIVSERNSLRNHITTMDRTEFMKKIKIERVPECENVLICAVKLKSFEFEAFSFNIDVQLDDVLSKVLTLNKYCVDAVDQYANILGPLMGWLTTITETHFQTFTYGSSKQWASNYKEIAEEINREVRKNGRFNDQLTIEDYNDIFKNMLRDMGIRIYLEVKPLSDEQLQTVIEIHNLVQPFAPHLARDFIVAVATSAPGSCLLSKYSKYGSALLANLRILLTGKLFNRAIHSLIHEEQRSIAPIVNGSTKVVKLTGDESFFFDIESASTFVSDILSRDEALEGFRHFVGPVFDKLDLSKSFITGSAIPACCFKANSHRPGSDQCTSIDLLYPPYYTKLSSREDWETIRVITSGREVPSVVMDWEKKAGSVLMDNGNAISFTLEDGADVDIAIDDTLTLDDFDKVVAGHFEVIKKQYPMATCEKVARTKGYIYEIDTPHRKFQLYQSSIAHIATHHVGPVRGFVTDVNGKRVIKLTATAVISMQMRMSYNYYYFASKSAKPLDILGKYQIRGFGAPHLFEDIVRRYFNIRVKDDTHLGPSGAYEFCPNIFAMINRHNKPTETQSAIPTIRPSRVPTIRPRSPTVEFFHKGEIDLSPIIHAAILNHNSVHNECEDEENEENEEDGKQEKDD